jgi:hypothetical protein
MREQDQELQRDQHPAVYEAARQHWEALADPAGLQEEFTSNYLGCWPNQASFGSQLARDSGLPDDVAAALAEQLSASAELAFVSDDHGVHVFVHPVGPDTRQEAAVQRLRHLQLVPRVLEDDEVVRLEQATTRPRRG